MPLGYKKTRKVKRVMNKRRKTKKGKNPRKYTHKRNKRINKKKTRRVIRRKIYTGGKGTPLTEEEATNYYKKILPLYQQFKNIQFNDTYKSYEYNNKEIERTDKEKESYYDKKIKPIMKYQGEKKNNNGLLPIMEELEKKEKGLKDNERKFKFDWKNWNSFKKHYEKYSFINFPAVTHSVWTKN